MFKWQYFGSTGLNIQKLILSLSFLLFKCRFYKNFNSLWGSHLQLTIGFLSDDTAQWHEFDVYFYVIFTDYFAKLPESVYSMERQTIPETKVLFEFFPFCVLFCWWCFLLMLLCFCVPVAAQKARSQSLKKCRSFEDVRLWFLSCLCYFLFTETWAIYLTPLSLVYTL